MTDNNKNNVSLGKPMVAGGVYWAPAGTTLPKNAVDPLDAAFANVGYLSEDGVTNATDTDSTEGKEMGGSTVLHEISSYGETFQFTMIETNETSLKLRYGSQNVASSENGIAVYHSMPSGEIGILVIEILLTGNKVKRIVVPEASASEFGDITYDSSDLIGYDVTMSAGPSAQLKNNASSVEYIAPIAKEAAAKIQNQPGVQTAGGKN